MFLFSVPQWFLSPREGSKHYWQTLYQPSLHHTFT